MTLLIVADTDLRERMRCTRILANQTSVSALGAATWQELEQMLDDAPDVEMVLYAQSLAGAPADAIRQLLARAPRLLVAVDEDEEIPKGDGLVHERRPVSEQALVAIANGLNPPSAPDANFVPVDLLQMIGMSAGSHVVVLSREGRDVGAVELRAGEVWTAFDALGSGEEAFARLVQPEMRARLCSAADIQKERTIFKSLHTLVLESLQSFDEGKVQVPPPIAPLRLEAELCSPERLATRVEELNREAKRLLMSRSYDRAAGVLLSLSELDPTSHLVRANLEQLRRLGFPQ